MIQIQSWSARSLRRIISLIRPKKIMVASTQHKSKNIIKILPGSKGTAKLVKTEIEAFSKLIDDSIIADILHYTNLFIERKRMEAEYCREREGKTTTESEILALLGMLFLIGTKKGSRTNVIELWTNDGTGMPILRACMSYKRFLFLLRSIRFDDKESRELRKKIDKLAAIRVILEKFNNNCKTFYNHGEFVTIDEKLEPFRGRCSFIHAMEVYCGKQPEGPYFVSNSPSDVVERLTTHIKGTNRNLTTDNWYTNYPLACSLLKQKITTIGTLRKNKAIIPPEFLPNKNRVIGSSLHGFQKESYKEPEIQPQKDKLRKKRGRCTICGRAENKYTSTVCDNCENYVCEEHSTTDVRCDRCNNQTSQQSDEES
ncbi:uncharacterized protein CBL_12820 [Carabus blaptoides fortunei]